MAAPSCGDRAEVSMDQQKLLLLGSGGMVGQNLLEHPSISGFHVFAPSRKELDLRDAGAVEGYIRTKRPDVIIHAAGLVGGIQANIADPVRFLVENVDIGRNVILGARSAGVKKLLNLGSSCMYPKDAVNPLTEDLVLTGALEPTNEGYALAKIYAAKLCAYISAENPDYQYKTLIPCNLYGRHDKFDAARSHLVPAVIEKIHRAKIQNESQVEIWGDGKARREFLYAGDFSDAVFHMLSRFESLPMLTNIGVGSDFTVKDYYEAAASVIGWGGTFTYDLNRPVGMQRKLVDVTVQTHMGWKPTTSLTSGIDQTFQFFLKNRVRPK